MNDVKRAYYFNYTGQTWVKVEKESDIAYIRDMGLLVVYSDGRPTKAQYDMMMTNLFHAVCDGII